MSKGRIIAVSAVIGAIVCALAAPAAAHVTVDPPSVEQGSTVKLSFLVPNEEPPATVTDVKIFFPLPPEAPIASVTVGQKPGWTAQLTMKHLTKPLVTNDGSISDLVSEIDWKASPAGGVKQNEFGEFTIDADGIPADATQVVFKAIQTYSNGDVVRWIDPVTPGGPAAEHPTPILQLTKPGGAASTPTTTAPSGSASATVTTVSTKDNSARAISVVAIVLGAIALVAATGASMKRRRTR